MRSLDSTFRSDRAGAAVEKYAGRSTALNRGSPVSHWFQRRKLLDLVPGRPLLGLPEIIGHLVVRPRFGRPQPAFSSSDTLRQCGVRLSKFEHAGGPMPRQNNLSRSLAPFRPEGTLIVGRRSGRADSWAAMRGVEKVRR